MFAESDLMGIPHRVVIGDRGLAEGNVEYKSRKSSEAQTIALTETLKFIEQVLTA
jgi:prolyl-tRNA synthetase